MDIHVQFLIYKVAERDFWITVSTPQSVAREKTKKNYQEPLFDYLIIGKFSTADV